MMNGMLREHQLGGDLSVGEPFSYKGSPLPLAAREGARLLGLVLWLGPLWWGGGAYSALFF